MPRPDCLYIAFNKPFGVLSQFSRSESLSGGETRPTLADFGFPPDIYPVGRLDHDSEGLLLLSDDAALNHALLHPSRRHERTYLAQVEQIPAAETLRSLSDGVIVREKLTLPAKARAVEPPAALGERSTPIRERKTIPTSWIELKLIEGRNRQVRRMTAAVGHPTLRLVRVAIGHLNLFELGLDPGKWRRLTETEIMRALQ